MRIDPCVLATICVPWTEDYRFDERLFRDETRYLLGHGLHNLYVFGTAGEGYAVTTATFRRISTVFWEEMRSSSGLRQLGIIALSTDQIRERIDIGLEIGFEEFQIALPSWGMLNDVETRKFFDDVLGAYPQARFLHYNTARGLRILSGRDYAQIAADHKNLVATKSHGSPSAILELIENAPELCHFFGELDFAYASLFGQCGLLVSISTLNPEKSLEIWRAGVGRDVHALVGLSAQARTALQIIYDCLGPDRIDGAYDKTYCRSHVPRFPLRLLPPYEGVSEGEYAELARRLSESVPEWVAAQRGS